MRCTGLFRVRAQRCPGKEAENAKRSGDGAGVPLGCNARCAQASHKFRKETRKPGDPVGRDARPRHPCWSDGNRGLGKEGLGTREMSFRQTDPAAWTCLQPGQGPCRPAAQPGPKRGGHTSRLHNDRPAELDALWKGRGLPSSAASTGP